MKNNSLFSRAEMYQWHGKNKEGKIVQGEISATSYFFAKVMLQQQGISSVRIKKWKFLQGQGQYSKIKYKDITLFTRQLSTLLIAGIALLQALQIIAKGVAKKQLQEVIKIIISDIAAGQSFAFALQKHSRYFNQLFCSLINTGEQIGCLDTTLLKIVAQREKLEDIKNKVTKALVYPSAVFFVAVVITGILLVFVVPTFKNLFSDFGASLPWFTQFVICLSESLQKYYWLLCAMLFFFLSSIVIMQKRWIKFANLLQSWSLSLPLVGVVLKHAAIARFSRTLAITFAAGLPLDKALQIVAQATGNVIFNDASVYIGREIVKGETLQQSMRKTAIFPEMVIQMVHIGEEAGALEQMLAKIADYYEQEVDNRVVNLMNLCEPLVIIILSILVGGLVMAMYLPIFKLGSVV
jgi:type IV pilus assembly protein PilC